LGIFYIFTSFSILNAYWFKKFWRWALCMTKENMQETRLASVFRKRGYSIKLSGKLGTGVRALSQLLWFCLKAHLISGSQFYCLSNGTIISFLPQLHVYSENILRGYWFHQPSVKQTWSTAYHVDAMPSVGRNL
jgi:hypothetical protein